MSVVRQKGEAAIVGDFDRAERRRRIREELCEARPRIVLIFSRRLGNHDEAEDLAQTALAECLEKLERDGPTISNPGGFLYEVARRRYLDLLRLSKRNRRHLVDADLSAIEHVQTVESDRLTELERVRRIMECLPALRADEREVLRLRFFDELPTREVAERLSMDPATVSRLQWRALDKIRRMVAESDDSP